MSWKDTILRQYAGAENIINIIDTFSQAVSLDDFTDNFIDNVWEVTTAGSYGLDVWGKIVNIGRYVVGDTEKNYFGFSPESNTSSTSRPFNTYNFYAGNKETSNVRLGDDAYRTLILAKSFANISIGTIPEINRFLTMLFKGRGVAYCANYQGMEMGIVVKFKLQPYEKALLKNFEVMPIPSGVDINLVRAYPKKFGFSDGFYPFNEGTFNS